MRQYKTIRNVVRDSLPGEEWREIPGLEGRYEVSNLGRVWSVPRPQPRTGGFMNPWQQPSGHMVLELMQEGRRRRYGVHQLVARGFYGLPPEGMEVRHLDGDPTNNRVENLRYGTRSENLYDKVRHGTDHNARKTHCPRNHPYDAANTAPNNGGRRCRACQRIHKAAYLARLRANATP